MTGAAPVVTDRQLNRTTLERQLLLERVDLPVLDAVGHLVGLQAQIPQNPYVALWSRLQDFDPEDAERLILDHELVRIIAMRATLHLLPASQCRGIRRVMQPVMDAEIARHSEHKSKLVDVDMDPVLEFARRALAAAGSLSNAQLRAALEEAFPDFDAPALAYACRCYLQLVQVPPRGLWSRSGTVRTAVADDWLAGVADENVNIDELVLRYLAAFGPASTADVAAWSRLTGLREVTDRLDLRRYRDERGRELLDLPDATLVDPDTPARTVFLPEYDNALLSHQDRRRFLNPDAADGLTHVRGPIQGTALVDGLVAAVWRVDRATPRTATLVVTAISKLATSSMSDLEAVATQLATFALRGNVDVQMQDCPRE